MRRRNLLFGTILSGVLLLAGCESDSYVLVNVTLGNITVDQIVIRGYPDGRISEQKVEVLPEAPGEDFTQSVNLVVVVPDSWTGRLIWLTAEGVHDGVIVGHGRTSVLPRKGKLVDANITLSAGAAPCGNGIIEGSEECDGTALEGNTCANVTGKPDGLLACVNCEIVTDGCHDCGDGVIEDGVEQCDGEELGGETCVSQGFVQGELGCTDSCQLDLSGCAQGCGNNVVEDDEACDGVDLLGQTCADFGFWRGQLLCTPDCELDLSACAGYCGDGDLDPGESCDGTQFGQQTCLTATGHSEGSLACTGDCHLDVSGCFTPQGACGDGQLDAGEACDGSDFGGQTCLTATGQSGGTLACTASCHLDVSGCFTPQGVCGDGQLDAGEACDGSAFGGQTCLTAAGHVEGDLACTAGCFLDLSACHTCGNGVREQVEECDGLALGGESCQTLTGLPDGSLGCTSGCTFDVSGCTVCGDGLILAAEACDDGSNLAGDGCDASCQVEPGWSCTGQPSQCSPLGCGDGWLAGAEACDDGNLQPGDGCDAACQVETGFVCHSEPSTCVADASALFVDCGAPCTGIGTRAEPLCGLQDAVTAAATGMAVVLLSGTTCVESVTVTKDLHLVGEPGASLNGPTCPALYVNNADVTVWELTMLQGVEADNFGNALVQRCDIGPSPCIGVRCRNLSHCTVLQNRIHENDDGGLWISASSYSVQNNVIYRNGLWGTSSRGGLWINVNPLGFSPTEFANNTVVFNEAQDASFHGGIRCISSNTLINNIVWGNTGPQLSSGCDPYYSIIMDPAYIGLQGNQFLNPMFQNANADDYHLSPWSPAINAGDPAGVPPAPAVDLDGTARPLGSGVDVGAYEAQ